MEQPDIPESDAPEQSAPVESEEVETLDQDEPEEQVETTDEEIEHEGKKYRVPKELKDSFLRHGDYTQKTQTVAEERKAIEAERTRVQQQAQEHEAFLSDVAEVRAIDKQLKQYEGINWQQLIDADPQQAMKLEFAMRQLQSQKEQLSGALTQKQQQRAFQTREAEAAQMEQAQATLKREIPNWSPEYAKTLRQHALDKGVPKDALDKLNSAIPVMLLHDSYMLKQLMAKQTAKPKPEAQEKPVTRIAAVSNAATRDPEKMSTDDWMKWRNAQVRKSR